MLKLWKKLFIVAVFSALLSPSDAMAFGKLRGYAEQGGQRVSTALVQSSTKVQRSYPGATVTVYLAGTSTEATLYSDESFTPKANPFAADSTGFWSFYADDGDYDITFSDCTPTSCGITSPWTFGGIRISSVGASVSYNVRDFGAIPDDSESDQTAIENTIAACDGTSGRCVVAFQCGTYNLEDTVSITKSRVNIVGCGQYATTIDFEPTGTASVFKFDGTLATLAQNSLKGFGFTSSDTTFQKVMLELIDVEEFEGKDLASSTGSWVGNTSIGILVQGRQFVKLQDLTLSTNLPIYVDENPTVNLDADFLTIENAVLTATNTNANIYFATSTYLSNTKIDHVSCNLGGHCIYWEGGSLTTSHGVYISGVRWEQSTNATGYMLFLNGPTRSIIVDDLYGGVLNRGVYIRNSSYVNLRNIHYVGTGVALDVDSTVAELSWFNCYWGAGASSSITGLTLVWAGNVSVESTVPLRPSAIYTQTANGTNQNSPNMVGILLDPVTFATLGAYGNGYILYCSDCNIASPCTGGGNGAIAKRLNGAWVCN